ncbi:MAG: very short patch repair endonuclease [Bacteroidales bacterium]|nr:very short patch repair endonuclease [Bacteroidales bacterium]
MTREQRHRCMASIKGVDTKPEMLVRRYLHGHGFRYSLHSKRLPGKPDLVLRKYHSVIFVHGCFWHGHPGESCYRKPSTNVSFWEEKIRRNKERDAADVAALEALGWHVLVVWECELAKQRFEDTMTNLIAEFQGYLEVQHIHSIPLSVRKLSNQDPSEL